MKKIIGIFVFILAYGLGKFVAQTVVTQTFSYTGSIQNFTVPSCVSTMTIEARGAQGGGGGGFGARMIGTFTVASGQVLKILVGQAGGLGANQVGNGGGGGSFVTLLNNTPLCIAGGGGGTAHNTSNGNYALIGGTTAQPGQVGQFAGAGNGGAPGNGGFESYTTGNNTPNGGGGGGLITNGGTAGAAQGGSAFVNGGAGGPTTGGFGGGGGSNLFIYGCGSSPHGGSGGGGYSGGGAGGSNCNGAGGGGGSFNSGTNQSNTSSFQSGNGLVVLTYGFNGNGVAAVASPSAICNGSAAILTASGMTSYTWSNGSNSASISVSPNITTNYTVSGTNSVGCISTSTLAVIVSTGVPVLSVLSSTNSLCLGKTATLTASGALTHSWTNGVINGVSFTPSVTNTYTVFGQNGCGTTTAVTTISVAPLPISAISSPTTICAGSPATLTAVSPATLFTWQPFAINGSSIAVNPTTTIIYTVTATDGTCSGVTNVTLNVNPVPTIGIVASSSNICSGSVVNFTASGGLTYTWSPMNLNGVSVSASPTTTSLFSVVGSNSVGCTSAAQQVVVVSNGPNISINASSQLVCSGAPVVLTGSGANNYTWSPNNVNTAILNDNPQTTTVYTLTGAVQGNSCASTSTIQVQVLPATVIAVSSSSAICSGKSATLTASGANSYQWIGNPLPGATHVVSPTVTTQYTVTSLTTASNVSCPASNTIQLVVNANPNVTASATKTNICKGEISNLSTTGAVTYSWNTGSTNTLVPVTPSITTNYTVTGTDANNCSKSATLQVRVNACTGLSDLSSSPGISIYPNPSLGEFIIEAQSEMNLSLVNQLGQTVKLIKINAGNNYKVNISGLANGVYFVVGDNGSNRINQKVIVNK